MQMRYFIFSLIFILFTKMVFAQDIHFTNFQYTTTTYNPANTGAFEGNFRGNLSYKNQWQSVPVKYNTFQFNFDFSLIQSRLKNDKLGIGVQLMHDKAGDAGLQQNILGLTIAYTKHLSTNQFLSLGFGFQMHERRFDISRLQFDEENIEPENFNKTKINFFNSSFGFAYRIKFTEQIKWTTNIALFNILQPKSSFFEDNNVKIPNRFSASTSIEMRGDGNAIFIPKILYTKQQSYQEIVAGIELKYLTKESYTNTQGYHVGINWRSKDALSPFAGYFINGFTAIISYDINTSAFERASRNNGGFEASIIYIHPNEKVKKRKGKCPIF